MKKIFNTIETPFFVIKENILNQQLNQLKESLNHYWNNYIIGYSFKTNSLPWIVEFFKNNNCYAEVVSDDEYELSKLLGYNNDNHIIYNGPIKTRETLIEAINNNCIVNIDSLREVNWVLENKWQKKIKIGIRVNFDIEKLCKGESVCNETGGRFGFCYENGELKKIIDNIKLYKNILISGIHLHCSSKTRSLNIYKAIAEMACKIKKEYELDLEYIDVGGGFFGGMENKPQFRDYIREITYILNEEFSVSKTKLIVEPGISLIGPAIDFVTSVIDVKDTTYSRFVLTDGSRINVDPFMNKYSYFYDIVIDDEEDRNIMDKQIICGFTCMENDRLFDLKKDFELKEKDIIVYHKVGAYTMCLNPLFIKYFPDVYLEKNGKYFKIRKKWSCLNYIQNSIIDLGDFGG